MSAYSVRNYYLHKNDYGNQPIEMRQSFLGVMTFQLYKYYNYDTKFVWLSIICKHVKEQLQGE